MKNQILKLFYIEKLSQKEIAEILSVSKGYVSRIVTNDDKYEEFKKEKLRQSKIRHNKQIMKKVKAKRKELQFEFAVDDLILKKMHNQASMEMSKSNYLSNENYRKWNSSAFNYNPSKKRYEFNSKLGRSADIPKFIKDR